jgi:phosphonopyruvate decarboxylase
MIEPDKFLDELLNKNIRFFTGVPDSLLKEICSCIDQRLPSKNHIITANEGNAIALASGYYLATNEIPLVYMQNSGLGNAVNPLTSLADKEVYSIPLILMIGWRGEPDVHDEPQHIKQGRISKELLELLDIPVFELDSNVDSEQLISQVYSTVKEINAPVAILVKNNTFNKYKPNQDDIKVENKTETTDNKLDNILSREQILEILLQNIETNDIIVSTTGKTSREIFEIREKFNKGHHKDFLTVGCMGHTSSIAMGIALNKPERNVWCIDGDGSIIMHLGAQSVNAQSKINNMVHIMLNNGAHESVGGQKTVAFSLDFDKIMKGMGYEYYFKASSEHEVRDNMEQISKLLQNPSTKGLIFFEISIAIGSRSDLGRPTVSPIDNKKAFMEFVK